MDPLSALCSPAEEFVSCNFELVEVNRTAPYSRLVKRSVRGQPNAEQKFSGHLSPTEWVIPAQRSCIINRSKRSRIVKRSGL